VSRGLREVSASAVQAFLRDAGGQRGGHIDGALASVGTVSPASVGGAEVPLTIRLRFMRPALVKCVDGAVCAGDIHDAIRD